MEKKREARENILTCVTVTSNKSEVIKSFACTKTEKLFSGSGLSRKEINSFGALDLRKALARLEFLNEASENNLLAAISAHYHAVGRKGGNQIFSIDADERNSPWRIVFKWSDENCTDVELVRLSTETHQ